MKESAKGKAVIYCRVSLTKQAVEGHGLTSQEARCREYARYRGYEVLEVFTDDITGGIVGRPGMDAMLAFLEENRSERCVVVIDDISRLARGLEAHLKLRSDIGAVGAKLESPSIEFGEDSDSILVENLLASVSQHHRQKNAEQTRNRMRARAMSGYWVFQAPIGYRFERVSGHGKMLVRDEPLASIVTEALEGFASGRFETQAEVKRFLESRVEYPRDRNGEVLFQHVTRLLTRVIYAGYVDKPDWDIQLQPAKHEPLISYEAYQAIQKRLNGQAKAPARKDLNEDFPLRGFVTCGDCDRPMTAGWSRGRNASYPYYLCATKSCPSRGKSVRKERLEADFESLLLDLRPSEDLFEMALAMLRELWDSRLDMTKAEAKSAQAELSGLETKVDQLVDQIVGTDNRALISAYEGRIRRLEEQKAELADKVAQCGRPLDSFDETFRTTFEFFGNPHELWTSERLEDKRTVLKLAFEERLAYQRNEGFRTASTALPFRLLEDLKGGNCVMASPRGVEPLFSP